MLEPEQSQDKASSQLEAICKYCEQKRMQVTELQERVAYLERKIAEAHCFALVAR